MRRDTPRSRLSFERHSPGDRYPLPTQTIFHKGTDLLLRGGPDQSLDSLPLPEAITQSALQTVCVGHDSIRHAHRHLNHHCRGFPVHAHQQGLEHDGARDMFWPHTNVCRKRGTEHLAGPHCVLHAPAHALAFETATKAARGLGPRLRHGWLRDYHESCARTVADQAGHNDGFYVYV